MTEKFKWRTVNTAYVYVDSMMGSDLYGNGTPQNPYQSLQKAFTGHTSTPGTIVCRGYFSENMANGNHSTVLRADYFGAAVFDGKETYMMYGFRHYGMIIKNCTKEVGDLTVNTGNPALAGVGGAISTSFVGSTAYVTGVYGCRSSYNLIDNSPVYFGYIGGYEAVNNHIVYANIPASTGYKVAWWFYNGPHHLTVYNLPYANRRASATPSSTQHVIQGSIFAKVAFMANENLKFTNCLFTQDCTWRVGSEDITYSGDTNEERVQSLRDAFAAAGYTKTVFSDCIFSTDIAEELLNDPKRGDYTPRYDSDAVIDNSDYIGALPPCLNLKIMEDSSGVPNAWDENTCSGMISINNDAIQFNEDSEAKTGEIYSKVIQIDPSKYSMNGIYSSVESHFASKALYLYDKEFTTDKITSGTLPIGRYYVVGSIVYKDTQYNTNDIIVVEAETEDTIVSLGENSYVLNVNDPNPVVNACYVRYQPVIYKTIVNTGKGIKPYTTYLNMGPGEVIYNSRKISVNESFYTGSSTVETWGSDIQGATLGIIFDDNETNPQVPHVPWIPAQLFGTFFVGKTKGSINYDTEGIPFGSGNPNSNVTVANGGQSASVGTKTPINARYIQFKFVANTLT